MKKKLFFILSFLCLMVQGTWADAWVETEAQLTQAIADGQTRINLDADIELSNQLVIDGLTLTINLNGHKLSRSIVSENEAGHVFYAKGNCNLTLKNTADGSSSIERGNAFQGGAIYIESGSTVSAENIIFQNNSARDYGGAIYNNGTFTAKNCTFTNNIAAKYGAGIWNGGTLNMQGKITVTGNTKAFSEPSNVYLKSGTVINVTGTLTGSNIGMELYAGTFTSGYNTYNSGIAPNTIFTADASDYVKVEMDDSGEACLTPKVSSIAYIERSWDDTNKQVLSTEKNILFPTSYDDIPMDWQYKEVTSAPDDAPDQWFRMGGYSTTVPEFYVVHGDVNRETIVVQGRDVHLVLCNGATLTLTGGLKLEGDNKLYIHCQSYGDAMGKLIVTNSYDNAAGIGSAQDNGVAKTVGELVIYGGHIEVKGGDYGAGIGSCGVNDSDNRQLCNRVTVYGGYVKAKGGKNASGIGGGGNGWTGVGVKGGTFTMYDGTVITEGATGVGGGLKNDGGTVFVYGGSLTADGYFGSGIGCGFSSNGGGTVTISGGTVTADGSGSCAGIGGAGTVTISGGTVTATGGTSGAGIGGSLSCSADVTITGGIVTASGGASAPGIGNGNAGKGGSVTISGGTVTANGGDDDAGISCYKGSVTISGGTVTANGGHGGVGIGLCDSMTITGGTVTATGGQYAAGLTGGTVTISGGTVTATGGEWAAGIGGSHDIGGTNVTINGGTVIAQAGDQGGEGNRAIGPGHGSDDYGTLSIGDAMMVGAGDNGSVERIMDADERVNGCWYRSYAEISPCTHPGATYTIDGTGANGTHTVHCSHCATASEAEPHDFDEFGVCRSCQASVSDILGDVNGDGEVNVPDVHVLGVYILGKGLDRFVIGNADLNSDDNIDITDVTALVNIILKNAVVNGADSTTSGEN